MWVDLGCDGENVVGQLQNIAYHTHVNITIPDAALKGTSLTAETALLDLAIGAYVDERATLGQAARIASLSQTEFLRELGKRRIPIHYGPGDFAADMEVVARL